MPSGGQMRMSTTKADSQRLQQSVRQMEASIKIGSACKKGGSGKHPSAVNLVWHSELYMWTGELYMCTCVILCKYCFWFLFTFLPTDKLYTD